MCIEIFKKIETLEQLEALNIGTVHFEISDHGGEFGFSSGNIAMYLGVSPYDIPRRFGAKFNYLDGGVRGPILPSTFNTKNITGKNAEALNELAAAFIRVYNNNENLRNEAIDEVVK